MVDQHRRGEELAEARSYHEHGSDLRLVPRFYLDREGEAELPCYSNWREDSLICDGTIDYGFLEISYPIISPKSESDVYAMA